MRKLFIVTVYTVFLGAFTGISAEAQSFHTNDTLSVMIHFRQGRSDIDMEFRDNRNSLSQFTFELGKLQCDSTSLIHSINIETYASPEGKIDYNTKLSMDRAHSIRDYLLTNTSLSAQQIKVYSGGIAWSGLESALIAGDCPWREEALAVIRTTEESQRNAELMKIDNGRCWDWMYENIFNDLRSAGGSVRCIITHMENWAESRKDTLYLVSVASPELPEDDSKESLSGPISEYKKRYKHEDAFRVPVMAFRTNLLLPLLNAGVEIPLSNRLSLGADVYYPWLKREWVNHYYTPQRHCFQWLGGMFEVRYWLGRHHSKSSSSKYRLSGHSLGLMYSGGIYDIEFRCKGQQGDYHAIGLEYGYSLPLGRGRAHLDFDLGIGYVFNKIHEYNVYQAGGYLTSTAPAYLYQGIMPLRADIAIVVPVFSKKR